MKPTKITPMGLSDGSTHRAQLPPTYNMYQWVNHEPSYDKTNYNQWMLKIKELNSLSGLSKVYQDVCDGKVGPDEGLVVVMS